jgi:uncharacterized protein (DUF1015 family)
MSKTFNTAEMLANGRLCVDSRPCFYIYRQVYMGHTSFGLLGEISMQVRPLILRITTRTTLKDTRKRCIGLTSTARRTKRSTWDLWWPATGRTFS